MKKKFRTIIVDNIQYGWTLRHMGTTLIIWKDKKEIFELDINEFDNTETTHDSVTPKFVEKVIRDHIILI